MNEVSFKNTSIINKSMSNSYSNLNTTFPSSDTKPVVVRRDLNTSSSSIRTKKKITISDDAHNQTVNKSSQPPFYPASIHSTSKNLKKSIADTNLVVDDYEKAILFSTWTPMRDDKSNHKLYEARKQLFEKWYTNWSDQQRREAIEGMLSLSKPKQLFFTRDTLNKISPVYHVDFSRILPRVICLYIFSFLDPRSLCRSAQVCWYWKMLAEADQLWMAKCLRFGWNLNYIPNSFENGIWKQFYVENIKALQYIPVKKQNTPLTTDRSEVSLESLSNGKFGFTYFMKNNRPHSGKLSAKSTGSTLKQPPWKANNSNPNHFYRYNYLDGQESDRRKDHLIKTLALDSSSKKLSKSMTGVNKKDKNASKLVDPDEAEMSNLENLISKGEELLDQINKEKTINQLTQNLNDSRLNDDLLLQLATRKAALAQEKKDVWSLLNASDSESGRK